MIFSVSSLRNRACASIAPRRWMPLITPQTTFAAPLAFARGVSAMLQCGRSTTRTLFCRNCFRPSQKDIVAWRALTAFAVQNRMQSIVLSHTFQHLADNPISPVRASPDPAVCAPYLVHELYFRFRWRWDLCAHNPADQKLSTATCLIPTPAHPCSVQFRRLLVFSASSTRCRLLKRRTCWLTSLRNWMPALPP